MSRFAAIALVVLAGCASAEDANSGSDRDLAMTDDGADLSIGGGRDLAHLINGDGGGGGGGPTTCLDGKHIVINEVQVAGASASDEWIELYNPCSNDVDLTGARIVYRAAG